MAENRWQRLDAARRDGTRGLYRLECPACGYLWLCLVRWCKAAWLAGRNGWRVEERARAYCARCLEERSALVRGDRSPYLGRYEGWSADLSDAWYILGVQLW